MIEVKGLCKRFGTVDALNGLNLEVDEGIFGFIGPNGAGKTTTIKLLLGLLKPTSGEAKIFGYNCFKESIKIRKQTGVLHEKAEYPKEMTGSEYLNYVANIYEIDKKEIQHRIDDLIKLVRLEDAADRSIGGYSAGMKQRIGLAQALMGDPKLVFLDEPTANLDPIGRNEILETIRRLNREEGVSFVIASHVLHELQKVCDQFGVIHKGVILEEGHVSELAEKYYGGVFKVVSSNQSVLLKELSRVSHVDEVVLREDALWVRSSVPDALYDEVSRIVSENRLQLLLFQPWSFDLDEFYMSVIKGGSD